MLVNSSVNYHPAQNTKTRSAKKLFEMRDAIASEWMGRVRREVSTADDLQDPIIINTFPLFLEYLAEALCEECTRELATESSNVAEEHGGERARVTRYGPEQILHEYRILREVILARLQETVGISERDKGIIQRSFDKAVQESMTSYFLVHSKIREQFIATLTHDLRNPLSAIKLNAEIINAKGTGELKDYAQKILKGIKRADRMIQDMLDASVIQVGEKVIPHISKCETGLIIESVIADLSPEMRHRIKTSGTSVEGHWDADALQRALENLVTNAFKYGEDGSPVSIKVASKFGRMLMSVHNLGKPIPPENIEYLFQAFRRADTAKTSGKKGWGIGLALARSAAESMGGSIGVESSLDLGTTFTIDIPVDSRPYVGKETIEELNKR